MKNKNTSKISLKSNYATVNSTKMSPFHYHKLTDLLSTIEPKGTIQYCLCNIRLSLYVCIKCISMIYYYYYFTCCCLSYIKIVKIKWQLYWGRKISGAPQCNISGTSKHPLTYFVTYHRVIVVYIT
jgi:hypothetical protein